MTSSAANSSPAARCMPVVTEPGGAQASGHAAAVLSGSTPSPIDDAEARKRFLREARAL